MSMRYQFKDTPIRVAEIIPPIVETDMLPTDMKGTGMDPDEFAKSAVTQLIAGATEIGYRSVDVIRFTKENLDAYFDEWNNKKKTKAETMM